LTHPLASLVSRGALGDSWRRLTPPLARRVKLPKIDRQMRSLSMGCAGIAAPASSRQRLQRLWMSLQGLALRRQLASLSTQEPAYHCLVLIGRSLKPATPHNRFAASARPLSISCSQRYALSRQAAHLLEQSPYDDTAITILGRRSTQLFSRDRPSRATCAEQVRRQVSADQSCSATSSH
jgi:hypothetical protein